MWFPFHVWSTCILAVYASWVQEDHTDGAVCWSPGASDPSPVLCWHCAVEKLQCKYCLSQYSDFSCAVWTNISNCKLQINSNQCMYWNDYWYFKDLFLICLTDFLLNPIWIIPFFNLVRFWEHPILVHFLFYYPSCLISLYMQTRAPITPHDVGFISACCEYHWLIKRLFWAYDRVEQS